jgi:hypothetical protein
MGSLSRPPAGKIVKRPVRRERHLPETRSLHEARRQRIAFRVGIVGQHPRSATDAQRPIALGTPQLARAPRTLPQILLNQGWGDPDTVAARLSAWEHLLDYVRPDLVVADYTPTLLLALWKRGAELPAAQFGTGFCSPPPLEVWPDLRFWLPSGPLQAGRDDARLMAAVQQALQACGAPPLDYLGRIFDRPALLTTVPEFDTDLEYRAQGTTHLNV